jgi:(p)ppGpp synthase/HD superfamily hydrolase
MGVRVMRLTAVPATEIAFGVTERKKTLYPVFRKYLKKKLILLTQI